MGFVSLGDEHRDPLIPKVIKKFFKFFDRFLRK